MTDTTDPREGGSEYAAVLRDLDSAAAGIQRLDRLDAESAAKVLRALEAKVHRLEVTKAGLWEVSRKDFVTMSELRADRDRLAGEVERLKQQKEFVTHQRDMAHGTNARLVAELAAALEELEQRREYMRRGMPMGVATVEARRAGEGEA